MTKARTSVALDPKYLTLLRTIEAKLLIKLDKSVSASAIVQALLILVARNKISVDDIAEVMKK